MKYGKSYLMKPFSMILICVLLLCACGSKESGNQGSGDASTPAGQEQTGSDEAQASGGDEAQNPEDLPTVVYYTWTYGQNQGNKEKVFEKLNEITREKAGCNLEVHLVNTSEFEQQMQNKLAAGEQIDLMFTSNWLNLYSALVAREALLPIEDLLPVYAPEYYSMIPEEWWECTKVNGHIYGALNQQIYARQPYIGLDAGVIDDVGFDWESVETFADLTGLYELMLEKGYNIREWQYYTYIDPTAWNEYLEYEQIGGDLLPGVIRYENDGKPKVFNQFETEEFKELMELFRSWYEKGFTPADALTTQDRKLAVGAGGAYIPYQTETTQAEIFNQYNLVDDSSAYVIPIGEPFLTTASVTGTMISVTTNSKYPEKAVEVLNLINTDPEFYNLFIWGIEGEDYALNEEGQVVILETNQYDDMHLRNWAYGNTFLGYVTAGTDPRVAEATDQLNRSSVTSSVLGFNFDPSSVVTEVSNCNAVITEYIQPLIMGLLDLDTALPEFLQRLKDAGADAIIAEKQAQIDSFWEVNH